jgi:virginiamycin B lyase
MFTVRHGAIAASLVAAIALPAAVTAATPHHPTAANAHDERTVTAFPMADGSGPFGITAGPHGEYVSLNTQIGMFGHDDDLTTELLPAADPNAGWLTADLWGNVWISERDSGNIARLSPNGSLVEYPLPAGPDAIPQGTVATPFGIVYVAEQGVGAIARLNTWTGHVTEYPIPNADSAPVGLALGPDGNFYFTDRGNDMVGRMTPNGTFREWSLDPGAFPNRIVAGPDGAIWFTELRGGKIGRLSMGGTLTEYPVDGGPVGITVGADGQLYVVLDFARQVARVNLHGSVTATWDLPGALGPLQIAPGRGLDLWVTDNSANMVFRLSTHDADR